MPVKDKLIDELQKIDGLVATFSPELGNIDVSYNGRSFAHFHGDNILDLRLTKKVVKELGLSHSADSADHPKRSPNSPWIEIHFSHASDVKKVVDLVKKAIAVL